MPHKIGAYVRVSTEEQAQVMDGSIESQQHRLKGFVDLKNQQEGKWGKILDVYIDDGYSAKDTRRPAYQRMMKDIRSGKIDLILVTDISRLSRNIPDFCILLKDLETSNIRKSVGAQDSDLIVERDRVQKEIMALDADIEGAFRLHSQMDKNPEVVSLIQEKLEKLAERKKKLVAHRETILAKLDQATATREVRDGIEERAKEFKKGWPKASVATKKRLIRRLIDRVIYTRDGLHTFYVTAADVPTTHQTPQKKMASESSSGAIPKNLHYLNSYRNQPFGQLSDESVPRVRSGGG